MRRQGEIIKRQTKHTFQKHFVNVALSPDFVDIGVEEIAMILERDSLYVDGEEQVKRMYRVSQCSTRITVGVRRGDALDVTRCRDAANICA